MMKHFGVTFVAAMLMYICPSHAQLAKESRTVLFQAQDSSEIYTIQPNLMKKSSLLRRKSIPHVVFFEL